MSARVTEAYLSFQPCGGWVRTRSERDTQNTYAIDPSILTFGLTFWAIADTIEASVTCMLTCLYVTSINLDSVSSYPSLADGLQLYLHLARWNNTLVQLGLTRDCHVWDILLHDALERNDAILLNNSICFLPSELQYTILAESCVDRWPHIPLCTKDEQVVFSENCNDWYYNQE